MERLNNYRKLGKQGKKVKKNEKSEKKIKKSEKITRIIVRRWKSIFFDFDLKLFCSNLNLNFSSNFLHPNPRSPLNFCAKWRKLVT